MWTKSFQKRINPSARLFCFPFAGADAVAYRNWGLHLDPSIEVHAIQIPGRGKRLSEPPKRQIMPLVSEITEGISSYLDLPYWFFGHSYGAILAFETSRKIQEKSLAQPERLILSSAKPPQYNHQGREMVHRYELSRLKEKIVNLGGVPQEVIAHEGMFEFYLKIIQADLEALETYRYEPGTPLPCPLSLFFADEDPMVSHASMKDWKVHYPENFRLRKFSGGHFFFQQDLEGFLKVLEKELLY